MWSFPKILSTTYFRFQKIQWLILVLGSLEICSLLALSATKHLTILSATCCVLAICLLLSSIAFLADVLPLIYRRERQERILQSREMFEALPEVCSSKASLMSKRSKLLINAPDATIAVYHHQKGSGQKSYAIYEYPQNFNAAPLQELWSTLVEFPKLRTFQLTELENVSCQCYGIPIQAVLKQNTTRKKFALENWIHQPSEPDIDQEKIVIAKTWSFEKFEEEQLLPVAIDLIFDLQKEVRISIRVFDIRMFALSRLLWKTDAETDREYSRLLHSYIFDVYLESLYRIQRAVATILRDKRKAVQKSELI